MGQEHKQFLSIADVVKYDASNLGWLIGGLVKGAVHGLYTPFLVTTGLRQASRRLDEYTDLPTNRRAEAVGDYLGQLVTSALSQVGLISYALSQGRGREYFGVMVATNLADYLINANQRRREQRQ